MNTYPMFENYNAIEEPRYDAIPKDYNGIMGVLNYSLVMK